MKYILARFVLGMIAMLSLAACGVPEQSAAQSASAPAVAASPATSAQSAGAPKIAANATVLTIRTQGGLCRYGPCWSEKQIRADGSYHATDGTGAQKDGALGQDAAIELTQQIAAADFTAIRAQPFTGTCPTAADGQEVIYTFETLSGSETIASCQVAIDEHSPLFMHIATLIATIDQA